MSTPITAAVDAARESARQDNGQFGTQPRAEADVDLAVDLDAVPDFSVADVDEDAEAKRQELYELGGGVWEVRNILRDGGGHGVRHPDLKAIYELADRISSKTGATREDMLAGYDELDGALSTFHESARQAYVARDRAAARGTETPDPTAAYGTHDWRTAGEALDELHKARAKAVGQVSRNDFYMFTPEANAAVRAEMDTLAARVDAAVLTPREMKAAIQVHVKAIATSHPEVHDTEPEWAILDALNPLLERRGYAKITRDDLG